MKCGKRLRSEVKFEELGHVSQCSKYHGAFLTDAIKRRHVLSSSPVVLSQYCIRSGHVGFSVTLFAWFISPTETEARIVTLVLRKIFHYLVPPIPMVNIVPPNSILE